MYSASVGELKRLWPKWVFTERSSLEILQMFKRGSRSPKTRSSHT